VAAYRDAADNSRPDAVLHRAVAAARAVTAAGEVRRRASAAAAVRPVSTARVRPLDALTVQPASAPQAHQASLDAVPPAPDLCLSARGAGRHAARALSAMVPSVSSASAPRSSTGVSEEPRVRPLVSSGLPAVAAVRRRALVPVAAVRPPVLVPALALPQRRLAQVQAETAVRRPAVLPPVPVEARRVLPQAVAQQLPPAWLLSRAEGAGVTARRVSRAPPSLPASRLSCPSRPASRQRCRRPAAECCVLERDARQIDAPPLLRWCSTRS